MFLQIFLISGLTEDSWILTTSSAFNLLQCILLVEVSEKNLASHRYVVRKPPFQITVDILL